MIFFGEVPKSISIFTVFFGCCGSTGAGGLYDVSIEPDAAFDLRAAAGANILSIKQKLSACPYVHEVTRVRAEARR